MGIERIKATSDGLPERIRLSAGDAVAEVVPSAGMAMVSLQVDGREHLAMPAPLEEFMKSPHTGGIPLLYPWANRLRGETYSFDNKMVDLSNITDLKRDENALPMHGLLLRYDGWTILEDSEDEKVMVSGLIDWDSHDEFMRVFPFPHSLTVTWSLGVEDGTVIATSTLLVESKGGEVPVAAGWHPYLAPPVSRRADLLIEGPPLKKIELDDRGLPFLDVSNHLEVGEPESLDGPLGERVYDDLFMAPEGGFEFTIRGDSSSISISADTSWHAIQVYAKSGESFACIEPMVARTAGLSDDAIVEIARPGMPVTASFTVKISS